MEEGREEERRNYQRVRADRRRKERRGGGDNKGRWKDGKLKESGMMGRLIEEK